jgi:hypothetical protein
MRAGVTGAGGGVAGHPLGTFPFAAGEGRVVRALTATRPVVTRTRAPTEMARGLNRVTDTCGRRFGLGKGGVPTTRTRDS